MDENKIAEMMKLLDLTRDEAIELINEDKEVDRMTVKQAESDLTAEQKKAIKKIKGGAKSVKAVNAYGKTVTRERKADETKRELINILQESLNEVAENLEVTNIERQIDFTVKGRKFRIVLSAPRK